MAIRCAFSIHVCRFIVAGLSLSSLLAAPNPASAAVHINEVGMTDARPQWVELYNAPGDDAKNESLAGYVLTNGLEDPDDMSYTFPEDLPDVPPGAFVVVYFDGAGPAADQFTFDDESNLKLASLHSLAGRLTPFASKGGHVALYSSDEFSDETIVSFVAWIQPPGDAAADAVAADLWPNPDATVIFLGQGGSQEDVPPGPGQSVMASGGTIGTDMNSPKPQPTGWVVFSPDNVSPGAINNLSGLIQYLPPDDLATADGNVSFSWVAESPDSTFQFQLALDERFNAIVVDEPNLTEPAYELANPLGVGDYFWRVRIVQDSRKPGPWSTIRTFTIEFIDPDPQEGFEFIPEEGGVAGGKQRPKGNGGVQAQAAGSTITGTIRDARSHNPLQGVLVTLNPGAITGTTNASGVYTINNLANGMYAAAATLANYNTLAGNVNVTGNATLNANLMGNSHYAKRNNQFTPARKARKDTALLCVDGQAFTIFTTTFIAGLGSRCNLLASTVNLGEQNHQWDGSHYSRNAWGLHERNYCPYAMTQMLNWYYGGTITQDEVANWISVNDNAGNPWGFPTNPERGLRHDMGGWADKGLKWAVNDGDIDQAWAKPTAATIVAFIDAERPCGFVQCNGRNGAGVCTSSHYMVLDGYYWRDKQLYVRMLNTDNNGAVDANRRYSTQDFHSDPTQQGVNHRAGLVVPKANATARATDPRVAADTDGDGLMDFDEDTRFLTNKNNGDTETDCVKDKTEIRSYIFPDPVRNIIILQAARPEKNADSDGDGCKDGQEDVNRDGKYQAAAGESDVYKFASKSKPGDFNDDCLIDELDFLIFWQAFGSHNGDAEFVPEADFNQSDQVDLEDYQTWYEYYVAFNEC